jgi:hypothetical protein
MGTASAWWLCVLPRRGFVVCALLFRTEGSGIAQATTGLAHISGPKPWYLLW